MILQWFQVVKKWSFQLNHLSTPWKLWRQPKKIYHASNCKMASHYGTPMLQSTIPRLHIGSNISKTRHPPTLYWTLVLTVSPYFNWHLSPEWTIRNLITNFRSFHTTIAMNESHPWIRIPSISWYQSTALQTLASVVSWRLAKKINSGRSIPQPCPSPRIKTFLNMFETKQGKLGFTFNHWKNWEWMTSLHGRNIYSICRVPQSPLYYWLRHVYGSCFFKFLFNSVLKGKRDNRIIPQIQLSFSTLIIDKVLNCKFLIISAHF